MTRISQELEQILGELNSWWGPIPRVRPEPPSFRRRSFAPLLSALRRPRPPIQILRGPRQVGKTTLLYQLLQEEIRSGTPPRDILLVRFDLPPLREAGILPIVRWHAERIREPAADRPPLLLLDEVHKLLRWDEQVKHLFDTFRPRIVLTGSSSVLVARGHRESLAGRATTTDVPPFLFREVLEAWSPEAVAALPEPIQASRAFDRRFDLEGLFGAIHRQPPQRLLSWKRSLERYFNRGGYPSLHSGAVDEDRWADFLVETVFERVLGIDIPDLFPVESPGLLRHIYLEVARQTGTEIAQARLAEDCNTAGFRTSQPVVGKYLHFLADALLIREFRRYPLGRRKSARLPVKITLTDLGVRNAIFRGAPSLWESPPDVVGPLVETLIQAVLRGPGLQVHFYRDYRDPNNRRSPVDEVDYVVEQLDGTTVPLEVKFRSRVDREDWESVRRFLGRYESPFGIVVTRDSYRWEPDDRVLLVPLLEFLLAF